MAQAQTGGAVAALVEHPVAVDLPQLVVGDSLRALGQIGAAVRAKFIHPVIGVTGSSGKTSTKEMLRVLLGGAAQVHATAGNWNNRIGVPMTLLGLDSRQQDFAVIEAGINQLGEMRLLGEMIRSDLSLVTNVGPAHLELLGDLEGVAAEKVWLAREAQSGSPLVLPLEVLEMAAFRALAPRAIALAARGQSSPLQPRQTVRYQLQPTDDGATLLYLGEGAEACEYRIATLSRGIAQNAGLAILAARELGVSEAQIKVRIQSWCPEKNRGRVVSHGQQTFYIDCYNANPSSMQDALQAFVASVPTEQPRIYVLGGMNELGAEAEGWHQQVGAGLTLRPQDRAYLIGSAKLTQAYCRGLQQAGAAAEQVRCAEKAENVKSEIAAQPGALFLKGSRVYALERVLPFSL